MHGPVVSFVVPSYNYGRYLTDCVTSILRQEGEHDLEIIIVEDHSTDDSLAVARTFSDPRIRLVCHETNLGHVATINEGFSLARGRFVARIDSDDRYRPYYLREVLKVFRECSDVGLVYGDVALINANGEVTQNRTDRVHGGKDFKGSEFLALLEDNFVPAPTVIARREAWSMALPIPHGLGFSDWYLTLRIAQRYDFYYIARPLADYRVHPQNFHVRMTKDGSEEDTVFRLLGEIFAEEYRAEEKRRVRRKVYGAQCLNLANKYFGFGMDSDARRCYLRAVRHRPSYLLQPALIRRLAATCIGHDLYERSKSFLKSKSDSRS